MPDDQVNEVTDANNLNEENSENVFIIGRYNKYSRALSQTPWVIDGEKRMETSVQEIIVQEIEKYVEFEKYKFHACGREDVDVRMLGKGRPFVVELIKPKLAVLDEEIFEKIEINLNSNHWEVKVRDLQIGGKREVKENLKEGEADKTKSYTALCCLDREVTEEDLRKLNEIKDLSINQKTPVRVLHRRSLAIRPRRIHKIVGTKIESDPHLIRIDLTTEAGTYIKEFVHGDFGRTIPCLADILGNCESDIIKLDVADIGIDWPKALNRE